MEDFVTNKKYNIVAKLRYSYERDLKHFENEENLLTLLNDIIEANRGNVSTSKNKSYYNVRYIDLSKSTLGDFVNNAFLVGMNLHHRDDNDEELKRVRDIISQFMENEERELELHSFLDNEIQNEIKTTRKMR